MYPSTYDLEEVEHFLDLKFSPEEIADMFGVRIDSIARRAYRHHNDRVAKAFNAGRYARRKKRREENHVQQRVELAG